MRSSDDNVDLMSARLHRSANLRHPLRQRRKAGRKTRGHGSDMHPTAFEGVERSLNRRVVDANGIDLDLQLVDTNLLFCFLLDGGPTLRAQTAYAIVDRIT